MIFPLKFPEYLTESTLHSIPERFMLHYSSSRFRNCPFKRWMMVLQPFLPLLPASAFVSLIVSPFPVSISQICSINFFVCLLVFRVLHFFVCFVFSLFFHRVSFLKSNQISCLLHFYYWYLFCYYFSVLVSDSVSFYFHNYPSECIISPELILVPFIALPTRLLVIIWNHGTWTVLWIKCN